MNGPPVTMTLVFLPPLATRGDLCGSYDADHSQSRIHSEEEKEFGQQPSVHQVHILVEIYLVACRRTLHGLLVALGHGCRPENRNPFRCIPLRDLDPIEVPEAGAVLHLVVDAGNKGDGVWVGWQESTLRNFSAFLDCNVAIGRHLTKIDYPIQVASPYFMLRRSAS